MGNESTELDRIKRFGRVLRGLTLGLLLLSPFVAVFVVSHYGPLALVKLPRGMAVDYSVLTYPRALAIVGVGLLTPITFGIGFLFLYRLFGLYAQGVVFSIRNVAAIRRCGYVLIAVDGMRIVQSALTGPVLTALGAVKGYLAIEIGISVSVVGLAIVLISRVMELGCRIYENERLTI
jgi:hypothetical protein